jgi:hypothetical protein
MTTINYRRITWGYQIKTLVFYYIIDLTAHRILINLFNEKFCKKLGNPGNIYIKLLYYFNIYKPLDNLTGTHMITTYSVYSKVLDRLVSCC